MHDQTEQILGNGRPQAGVEELLELRGRHTAAPGETEQGRAAALEPLEVAGRQLKSVGAPGSNHSRRDATAKPASGGRLQARQHTRPGKGQSAAQAAAAVAQKDTMGAMQSLSDPEETESAAAGERPCLSFTC